MEQNELLDIYDENAERTGQTVLRGSSIRPGQYLMSVHLFIYNKKGLFLLQKRSKTKRSLPGIWSVTCGAVSSGENSAEAAIRELREELGLTLTLESLEFIERIKRRHSFIDIYFAKLDFDLSSCVLQKSEVEAIKLCTPKELINIINSSPNMTSCTYSASILRAMKERDMIK